MKGEDDMPKAVQTPSGLRWYTYDPADGKVNEVKGAPQEVTMEIDTDGTMHLYSKNPNITEFRVKTTISLDDVRNLSDAELDEKARRGLARELAEFLIKEDLIKIEIPKDQQSPMDGLEFVGTLRVDTV
jgi:hypothetical protein